MDTRNSEFQINLLEKIVKMTTKQTEKQSEMSLNYLQATQNTKKTSMCFIVGMLLLNILFFGYFLLYEMELKFSDDKVGYEETINQEANNSNDTEQTIHLGDVNYGKTNSDKKSN